MSDKVELYLMKKKQEAKSSDVAQVFQNLEGLYKKKLWHQLTQEIRKQVNDPTFVQHVDLKEFYDNFITDLEFRINLLDLAEIVMPIARKVFETNKQAAFDFLKKIQTNVKKDKQANIRVTSGLIELHLNNKDDKGSCVDIAEIRNMIEETQKEVDELVGVTPVHAPFYKVSATYLKEVGDHAGYYREALRYLGCEDAQKLTKQEKHVQAMLLGFAALLGEDIYNFGELLAHPILNALRGTDEGWIVDVLYSFNSGDLNKFREYENKWGVWNDINKNKENLEGKIRLLCLMEIALGRNSKNRHISFKEISEKALIEIKKVEYLVMKALSKGLVKGSIDQVNRTVHITWVQPRVLSPAQIYQMSERVGAWRVDVEKMETVVRENAKEILMKT
jgi:26S proteasome regulatory subunit N9|uniref:26S proteasome non-ATPase regulatory subunit 13 n=1 Tax=Panagrolaimus sp. PS1159 TaxID=55785 RepID=A0AC35GJG3_9BILA